MSSHALALLLLLSVSGDPKTWSFRDEVYQCGMGGMTFAELQSAGITLVSHVPCTKPWMEEAARFGVRGMPYISLYKVYDAAATPTSDPFWSAVDMTQHPQWVYVGADGKPARPFGNPQYPKAFWQSCTNTPGIAEAYGRGAAGVIQAGAGGVFIDNVLPAPTCYGPKFGVHQHLYPDQDNIYSFKIALRHVQDTVKGFGPNRAMMINVGRWDLWKGFGDCTMLESFIYNVDVRPGPGGWVGKNIVRIKQWPEILRVIRDTTAYVDAGGNFVTLEYLPADPEAAFYTYACAKLANFFWSGNMPVHPDVARTLYRCHMQQACGPLRETSGVYYRHYPQALAAVNTTDRAACVDVPTPGCSELADLFSNRRVPIHGGQVRLEIPPQAGRLYLPPRLVIDGYLRETLVALQTAVDHAPRAAELHALQRTIQSARGAQQAIEAQDADAAARGLARLCRELAECQCTPANEDCGVRLSGGPAISRAEVKKLAAPAATGSGLACQIERKQVSLTSGPTTWVLGRPGQLISLNGRGANCGLSIRELHAAQGWFKPHDVDAARIRTDTPNCKEVEITLSLQGEKSQQALPDVKLILVVQVRRGDAGLRVQSTLRNSSNHDFVCYFTWSTVGAGNWCSYPGRPAVRSERYVDFGRSDWMYVHPGPTGGDGLLVLAALPQSYGPFGCNIFSEPRTGRLLPGQERRIDFELYPVAGTWQENPAAMRAFCRARLYAAKAYLLQADQLSPIRWTAETIAGRNLRGAVVQGNMHRVVVKAVSLRNENGQIPGDCPLDGGTAVTFTLPPSLAENQDCRLVVDYSMNVAKEMALPLLESIDLLPRPSVSIRISSPTASWQGVSGSASLVLTNHLDRAVVCRMTVETPAQYRTAPLAPIKLAAGQIRTIAATVSGTQSPRPPRGVRAILRFEPPDASGEQEISIPFVVAHAGR